MFGQRDTYTVMHHINLGFFADAVLRELYAIRDAGAARSPASPNLCQALESLRALPGVEEPAVEPKRGLAFRTYEEYCVLRRVFSRSPAGLSTPQELLGVLAWKDAGAPEAVLPESLDRATVFFETLGDEAVKAIHDNPRS